MRHIPDRDRGASAVEYGLLVAAIAAVIVGTVFVLGGVIQRVFEKTCTTISTSAELDATCSPQPPPPTNDLGVLGG